jgi:hypothetical protein
MPNVDSPIAAALAQTLTEDLTPKATSEINYSAKDRTGLNLPINQVCDICNNNLPNSSFDLKNKNQHTKHLPDTLETTCKQCKTTTKKITKGAFVKTISAGSLLLSDAAVEWLTANNGSNQKMTMDCLGMCIRNGDLDAVKILIGLVQGKAAVYKVNAPNPNPDDLMADLGGSSSAPTSAPNASVNSATAAHSAHSVARNIPSSTDLLSRITDED